MTSFSFLFLAVLAASVAVGGVAGSSGIQLHPNPESFQALMAYAGHPVSGQESFPQLRRKIIQAAFALGEQFLTADDDRLAQVSKLMTKHFETNPEPTSEEIRQVLDSVLHARTAQAVDVGGAPTVADDPYSYFGFIPPYMGSVIPDGHAVSFETSCWKTNSVSAKTNANGSVALSFTVGDQQELFCGDHYMFGTAASVMLGVTLDSEGTHDFTWEVPATTTTAEKFDLAHKGIRLFRFTNSTLETIVQIVDTALLFVPEVINPVDPASTARNLYFMKEYAGRVMKNRTVSVVPIDESTIQSGDFFGVIRLDGLDPMLGWAMGSTTGHTTVAIRDDNGQLYIHESTVHDDYWPTNGIQRTPYQLWVQQAINASYQVVHAPLTKEAAAKFNRTAALHFFNSTQGLDYGYHNMLWGWIDTPNDNYPCLPPDFSSKCLQWELVEVLFAVLDKYIPAVGELLFVQAWNLRLGTVGLPPAELYMIAQQRGMDTRNLPTIVEEDTWRYNTTRYGKPTVGRSMVCCVFVCHTWKAAGLFDGFTDEVNCGELTNWDDYALTILDPHPERPEACIKADPENPLCQIVGDYTLELNNLATKKPFAHMAEKCPSKCPNYSKPADC